VIKLGKWISGIVEQGNESNRKFEQFMQIIVLKLRYSNIPALLSI